MSINMKIKQKLSHFIGFSFFHTKKEIKKKSDRAAVHIDEKALQAKLMELIPQTFTAPELASLSAEKGERIYTKEDALIARELATLAIYAKRHDNNKLENIKANPLKLISQKQYNEEILPRKVSRQEIVKRISNTLISLKEYEFNSNALELFVKNISLNLTESITIHDDLRILIESTKKSEQGLFSNDDIELINDCRNFTPACRKRLIERLQIKNQQAIDSMSEELPEISIASISGF